MYAIRSYYATDTWTTIFKSMPHLEHGFSNRERLIPFGGGMPIFENGIKIGAIGVSGGTEEEDVITSYSIHYTKLYEILLPFMAFADEYKVSLAQLPVYAESSDKGVLVDLVKAIEKEILYFGDEPVKLTSKEIKIIKVLCQTPGLV